MNQQKMQIMNGNTINSQKNTINDLAHIINDEFEQLVNTIKQFIYRKSTQCLEKQTKSTKNP